MGPLARMKCPPPPPKNSYAEHIQRLSDENQGALTKMFAMDPASILGGSTVLTTFDDKGKMTATEYRMRDYLSRHNPIHNRVEYKIMTNTQSITQCRLHNAAKAIMNTGMLTRNVSIVLPGEDFCALRTQLGFSHEASMRYMGLELLWGACTLPGADKEFSLWFNETSGLAAGLDSLAKEIIGCLTGSGVGELPEGAGSNCMGSGMYTTRKVSVTPSTATGDNGNPKRLADLSYEGKVKAAKEAVAAYAREKKLPSPEMLALFRELDDERACQRMMDAPFVDLVEVVDGDRHSLASAALGRAVNQVRGFESGGPDRDFIGAAAQRFTKMFD
jgi:hypothetical protein